MNVLVKTYNLNLMQNIENEFYLRTSTILRSLLEFGRTLILIHEHISSAKVEKFQS